MATLVDDPAYHSSRAGAGLRPKGYQAIRQYYSDFVAGGGAVLMSPKDRVFVDDHGLAAEGTLTTLVSGRIAKARG